MMTLGDLDLFYGKVKFCNFGFTVRKSEVDFSETIAACDLKPMDLINVSIEGQSHFLTLAQGCVHTKIQTRFSQKLLCRYELKFL